MNKLKTKVLEILTTRKKEIKYLRYTHSPLGMPWEYQKTVIKGNEYELNDVSPTREELEKQIKWLKSKKTMRFGYSSLYVEVPTNKVDFVIKKLERPLAYPLPTLFMRPAKFALYVREK